MRLLTRVHRVAFALLALGALAHPGLAQIPGVENPNTELPPQQEQRDDPLRRTTPRDAIAAFLRGVDRDDFVSTARYLQVTASQRSSSVWVAADAMVFRQRRGLGSSVGAWTLEFLQ
jgi:hypothetical protein